MNIGLLDAKQVRQYLANGALLVDVRSADEHRRERIEEAVSCPLPAIRLPETEAGIVIFHCRSGFRTKEAEQALIQAAQGRQAFVLQGGLNAWKKAGLPVIADKRQPLPLMRQVHIAAGSLVLSGSVLGYAVSPWFYFLCAAVGCGLLIAGLTGFCGMARLLKHMPWNACLRDE